MGMFWITVGAHERAVVYVDGQVAGVLEPGRHRRRRRAQLSRVDLRERVRTMAPQELLTADGVSVKVTASLTWQVSDPAAFEQIALDPESEVYLAVQLVLREELVGFDVADLIRVSRSTVTESVTGRVRAHAERVGIALRAVAVKDIVLPAELRAAYAELVATRQRGQAQLEAARAQTAALRSLANGARLLEDHPALARLRTVESAPPGSQIVLTLP
jgi:regulator of protease activity HflC (stomatin/prohibitin superfamily)